MKIAAGANFNSPFVTASLSAKYEKGDSKQSGSSSAKTNEALTWDAEGGETLLCSK
jgi:hypothetical protein